MPARTNDFQKLVALIEKSLSPKAKVTESAMIAVPGMSTPREVDILIEDQSGPYRIKVAAETKDEGRRLGVGVVEQLIGKYRGECSIHVNKQVIVSPRGFTKGAIEKAAAAAVELLTIEQAKKTNWKMMGQHRMQFRVTPHIHSVHVTPKPSVPDLTFAYRNGRMICHVGHDHGSLMDVAKCIFFHKWLPHNQDKFREGERIIKEKHNGNGLMNVEVPRPGWKLRLGGVEHPIDTLYFSVHIVCRDGPLTHQAYERRSSMAETKIVHHLKGVAGNAQLEVMFRQGEPIMIHRPKGVTLDNRPTDAEFRDALRSVFPDGITIRLSPTSQSAVEKPAARRNVNRPKSKNR